MQVSNEIIPIFLIQRHEGSAHNDKLYLVDIVAKFLQLFNSISCLNVGIVSGSYGSHWGRLIACIRLGGVFEVGIWTTRTINTNVACRSNMRTPMWFTHDGNNCNSTCRPDRFHLQVRNELIFVVLWHCTDDLDNFGCLRDAVPPTDLVHQANKRNWLFLLVLADEYRHDFRNSLDEHRIFIWFLLFWLGTGNFH